jgi:superfamily II RNA helicase
MFASPLHKDPRLPELYDLYARKRAAQDRVRTLKKRIQATHDVLQMEELKSRKRVLRRLGFTSADDIVDVKGRVACEISTGDELLLTELIFNGVFNPLAPEHCAGLLSCFVFTEKVRVPQQRSRDQILTIVQSEHQTKLKEELAAPLRVMQEIARRIAKVCKESKLPIVEEEYVQSFKVELMDAVVQWCRGASFLDICKASVVHWGVCISTFVNTSTSCAAHRPVRGQPYSCLPAIARAHPTDGPGCKSHRQRRTTAKVRKNIRDAREAKLGHLRFIVIPLKRYIVGTSTLSPLSLNAKYITADTQKGHARKTK